MITALLWYVASLFATQVIFLGHAAVRWALARRLGLEVGRVRIGWGPLLFQRQTRSGVRIEIRALPPLAMVAIRGHDAELDGPDYRTLYGRADLGKRLLLTLSSPVYYVLLMVMPLFAVCLFAGWPETRTPPTLQLDRVEPGSPADRAGIRQDDTILRVDGRPVRTVADLIEVVAPRAGVETAIELQRGEQRLSVTVTPKADADGRGRVGVVPRLIHERRPLGVADAGATALAVAWTVFEQDVRATVAVFRSQPRAGITGPIGMGYLIADDDADSGIAAAVTVFALSLVRFWLLVCLPLPFCAGGRLLLLLPEALGRPQPSRRAEHWMTRITGVAYVALLLRVLIA